MLLWSLRQPSCSLGCKHIRVVVDGLLQVPALSFGFLLLGILISCCQGELILVLSRPIFLFRGVSLLSLLPAVDTFLSGSISA